MEKGNRDEIKGLNPHSNGDNFSRSISFFFERIVDKNITIVEIKKNKNLKINKLKIIYIKFFNPCNWKLHILLYTI